MGNAVIANLETAVVLVDGLDAAEQGDPLGNNNLGFFYESGRGGLPKDDREAARLYQLAADDGESWGQYNLGRFHQTVAAD